MALLAVAAGAFVELDTNGLVALPVAFVALPVAPLLLVELDGAGLGDGLGAGLESPDEVDEELLGEESSVLAASGDTPCVCGAGLAAVEDELSLVVEEEEDFVVVEVLSSSSVSRGCTMESFLDAPRIIEAVAVADSPTVRE